MKLYCGLDGSVKEIAICIVDEDGRICREFKVLSHPQDISRALKGPGVRLERIGLEVGPLSQWLFEGLAKPAFRRSASRRATPRLSSRRR
jgi:transposase